MCYNYKECIFSGNGGMKMEAVTDALSNTEEVLEVLSFDKFIYDGKEYILNTPINIEVTYEDEYWSYASKDYTLDVSEKTREEALFALTEQFVYLCNMYLDRKDKELTKKAREIRDLFKGNLKEIRIINA